MNAADFADRTRAKVAVSVAVSVPYGQLSALFSCSHYIMPGWYVRRGEKVVGPLEAAKLKELAAAGKLLPTDQLAKDAGGPWNEARRTSLFAKPKPPDPTTVEAELPPPTIRTTAEQFPVQERQPAAVSQGATFVETSRTVVLTIGRSIAAAGGAVARSLSTRAQRRHEIKLAKIQAKVKADSQRPPVEQQAQQPPMASSPAQIMFAPQMSQTTVIKVVNQGSGRGGCGCSGCALVLLLIFLGLVALAVLSDPSTYGTP